MPGNSDTSIVTVKILAGGKSVDDQVNLYEMRVERHLNRVGSAEISIIDGDPAAEDFPLSDGSDFLPGNPIEIQVGFGSQTSRIFKGVVVSETVQIREGMGPLLIVRCKDRAIKMTVGRKSGTFLGKSDGQIIQALASAHGLTAKVDATPTTWPQMVQYGTTDWDFLVTRADGNGLVVRTDDDTVLVNAPPTGGEPAATLTFGVDIMEVESTVDALTQYSGVSAYGWDYKNQAVLEARASDPGVPSQGNLGASTLAGIAAASDVHLASTIPLDSGSLKAWADAQFVKSRLSKVAGTLRVFGQASLVPNQWVELKGLGTRFNGKSYVSGVEHVIRDGNWWSILTLGLIPQWFGEEVEISQTSAAAQLPAIRGLQNAVVKKIDQDPDGQTRIQVNLGLLALDSESGDVWARWIQPYATDKGGCFFMPEIGDEVVLGFLNDDPRYPVVLGSLYSSKHSPPSQPEEKNSKKVLTTRSQLTIEFDDENKVITLKTPAKNQMIFSDQDKSITIQDQNGNKIVLGSEGITVKSPASVHVEAGSDAKLKGMGVTIASDAQASVQAQASLDLSGVDVSVSAQTSLSASGSASTSISSGGTLSLSGAMISLN